MIKVAGLISFLQMQETALNSLVDRVSVEQAASLASLACQTLDNQTQAQLVHHTSHNVRIFDFNNSTNLHTHRLWRFCRQW